MAKVMKFCAACDEGFAEKFGFCPNCGGALAAYEMNPVTEKTIVAASNGTVAASNGTEAKFVSPTAANENPPVIETKSAAATEAFSFNGDDEILEIENQQAKTAAFTPAVRGSFAQDLSRAEYKSNGSGANANGNGANGSAPSSNGTQKPIAAGQMKHDNGLYNITFVEEKNASNRNLLLLGAFLLVTTVALGGVVYSLFERNLNIGALSGDDSLLAYVGAVEPDPIPDEPPPPKNASKGGGGGGGGREEPTPTSKGRLAPQMEAPPLITPTKTIVQRDNPELVMQATTVGNKQPAPTVDRYGDPASKFDIGSDGMGSGGGQGSGRGTGQGSGRGTGQGSGSGSGSGSGIGNGNGGGRGDGDGGTDTPPIIPKPKPPQPVGPTVGVSIISKPRPSYTDAARQNQVTGVVRLRVTFLASGQIGSVSPVSGLSYGLTEQAIAAAKQIRFEPAKVNGVAQNVTKQIEYSFSIY